MIVVASRPQCLDEDTLLLLLREAKSIDNVLSRRCVVYGNENEL